MTRAEAELHSIRTTIEAYNNILKTMDLSEEKRKEIEEKIIALGGIRDRILSETSNYGLKWENL